MTHSTDPSKVAMMLTTTAFHYFVYFILLLVLQVFVVRELSPDTDLEIYNKMLAVQHNPKFAHYFAAAAADGMMAH